MFLKNLDTVTGFRHAFHCCSLLLTTC